MPAQLPFVLLLAGAAPVLPVRVEGEGLCPAATEVETRLRALVPAGDPTASQEVARIEEEHDSVRVILHRPAVGIVAERRLARAPSCSAMAAAVALAIASWETNVRPEFPVAMAAATVSARAPPVSPAAIDLGVALVIGRSQSWAPGLLARASFTPGGRRFGPSVFIGWEATRTDDVGSGRVSWRRWEAALGVHHRWRGASVLADAHLELGAALVDMRGAGFEQTYRRLRIMPEAAAGWRVCLPLLRSRWQVAPWADLRALAWPRKETAIELPSMSGRILPPFALMLAVGIAAGRFQ
jgi:hypothetical protein